MPRTSNLRVFSLFIIGLGMSLFALHTWYGGEGLPVLAVPSVFAMSYGLLTVFYYFGARQGWGVLLAIAAGLAIHAGLAVMESFKLTDKATLGIGVWTALNGWAGYQLLTRPLPDHLRVLGGFSLFLNIAELLLIVLFYGSVLQSML